jgi:hypothetical protein
MSEEEIFRLAGETPESSFERKRLETKRGILESGLQGLKSLHKRRNTVKFSKQDHATSDNSTQMSIILPNRSWKASATSSTDTTSWLEAASPAPNEAAMAPAAEEWPPHEVT